jgi:hypothetical protein
LIAATTSWGSEEIHVKTRRAASLHQVPALRKKLPDRLFPNAFLHTQLVIKKVISEYAALAIYAVNAHPIAIAVGTDQADFQIVRRNFPNRSRIHSSHQDWMRDPTKGMLYASRDGWPPLHPNDAAIDVNCKSMQNRVIVFAIFAAAILFSTIREWSAPEVCQRLPVARTSGFTSR